MVIGFISAAMTEPRNEENNFTVILIHYNVLESVKRRKKLTIKLNYIKKKNKAALAYLQFASVGQFILTVGVKEKEIPDSLMILRSGTTVSN